MQFNVYPEFQAASPAALLFVATPQTELSHETAHLAAAALAADKNGFKAAEVADSGSLRGVGVLRLTDTDTAALQKAAQEAAAWAQKHETVEIDLRAFAADEAVRIAQSLALAANDAAYRFTMFRQDAEAAKLANVAFIHPQTAEIQAAAAQIEPLLYGINLCKDLANTAPNVCTPEYLARTAQEEAQKAGASAKLLSTDYIREHMGSFWAVAKGSVQAPYLIELSYFGAADKNEAPIALVGKGVTFDSGGISLKPGAGMDEMKFDMGGAASVIGTFIAVARAKLPVNLVAVVPACENMPDAGATKPGDVVTSMNGTTIEILNTDAEGRLILCDALTYTEQFKPRAVIDVATLTGACIIALGHVASGLTANNQELADELLAASRECNDKAWQLPLFEEYKEQLKSNFADLQNIGDRSAGTIVAAAFLSHFAQNYRWAHLDIAGTAWRSGKDKGATGRPVPLLWQFIRNAAK